jgi:dihydrofolate reductase
MGKIVVSENATLDGVISDPTGEAGTSSGGWFTRMSEQDFAVWGEHEHAEAESAAALLMGGGTYRYFTERWADREGAWADRLRTIRKYVVSSTLDDTAWGTTTVLTGDVSSEVSSLKEEVDGEIVVYGSGQLVHTLWEHGLVDELRVIVYPFLAGDGQRILPSRGSSAPLELVDTGRIGSSLTRVTYRPSAAA